MNMNSGSGNMENQISLSLNLLPRESFKNSTAKSFKIYQQVSLQAELPTTGLGYDSLKS